jgi:alkylation response protein AidB-like acyl-CoA dehydrogenase
MCRTVISECFKWAKVRKVAGKSLLEMPQIRAMLAEMIAATEACQTWCYEITHQMNKMSYAEQSEKLAGPIALLKYQCTRTANMVADKSVQIFGGRGITKTGMGRIVETFQRTNQFSAILGGAEGVMLDLGARQAMKNMPNEVL